MFGLAVVNSTGGHLDERCGAVVGQQQGPRQEGETDR